MAAQSHDIIVIGASAGGVEAVQAVVREFPRNLPASVFVVLHLSPTSVSVLPQILSRSSPLRVRGAKDRMPIERGTIYVAPPDFHLLLEPGRIRVVRGPTENLWRPAIDPLFRSAALAYGPRVIGVVLTGFLDDGSAGLHDVKRRGGIAVVQDPRDSLFPDMPVNALRYVRTKYVAPLRDLGALLVRLTRLPVKRRIPKKDRRLSLEVGMASMETNTISAASRNGTPSGNACPECFGPLWRQNGTRIPRFRCHVGHAFSPHSLLYAQARTTETGLLTVLRSAEERIALVQEMAKHARDEGQNRLSAHWEVEIRKLKQLSRMVRGALSSGGVPSVGGR